MHGKRKTGWTGISVLTLVVSAITLVCPTKTQAQTLFDRLTINGYGSWAYGETDVNHYMYAGPEGEYDHAFAALTLAGKATDDVTIFIQPNFENTHEDFEVDLAFAFADWKINDSFSLRAGRVRHPFGIYTEIYDVGTLRPFLALPQGLYNASFVARAYNGFGLSGRIFTKGDWTFEYDVYAGQIDMKSSVPGIDELIERKIKDTIGGRFVVITPLEGLRFGLSAFDGEQQAGGTESIPITAGSQTVWGLFVEYLNNGWSIRSEYASQDDAGQLDNHTAYAEIAYMITDHVQVAGRWDWWDSTNKELQVPPEFNTLLEHEDLAVALNYWVNPGLVFKLEYHSVDGNRFAGPEDLFALLAGGGTLSTSTKAYQLGVNFSF